MDKGRLMQSIDSPQKARNLYIKLNTLKEEAEKKLNKTIIEIQKIQKYLALSDKVTEALEILNKELFDKLLGVIEEKMSIALQEVLEQPIRLKAKVDWKRNSASVDFWIEREKNKEDIMKGQGGSVANIISVGLRMFALTALDEKKHRRFLVLDEQDCWLHPDLVPRLVKIVLEAGRALGFQILMISHHNEAYFKRYADKVYKLVSKGDSGVELHEGL